MNNLDIFLCQGERIYKVVAGGVPARKVWLLTMHRVGQGDVTQSVSKGKVVRNLRQE